MDSRFSYTPRARKLKFGEEDLRPECEAFFRLALFLNEERLLIVTETSGLFNKKPFSCILKFS